MSEYQYYEFKAIDNALNENQKAELHQLSSRAEVSSHHASFVYHYGDFRGNVEQLMQSSFDAMVYLSNWGNKRLMFRLPCDLVDTCEWRDFFISEAIEKTLCSDKQNFILDFNFQDEDSDSWTEGEGWLDDLCELRNDIIGGDFRVLYLAWLKACQLLPYWDDGADKIYEPLVPAGLNDLNPALKQFILYVELDEQLVNAAAQKSPNLTVKIRDTKSLIAQLSPQEQQQFLVKLSNNEANLSAALNHRLNKLNQSEPAITSTKIAPRTYQELTEIAEDLTLRAEKKQQEKIKKDRENELKSLLGQQEMMWRAVDDFIEQKNSSAYNKALKHLITLHELAAFEKKGTEFNQRILKLKETYSRRRGLLERLNRIHLF
ncbi:MAG: hypothetical protein GQ583_09350 [Methyloprofundus sp.]|nr:hypothetical protein [Methyloprofundus sp.]